MAYKPKIISGKVKGTGWPIDGHVLAFAQWDYDREFWHLYGWDDADDEAVMETMYRAEIEYGINKQTCESFKKKWLAKKWQPAAPLVPFRFILDNVEVVAVLQEEEPEETREKMIAAGFDLSPRKEGDTGGILCLPLDENLNGDTAAKHPDWDPVSCPICGRKCWKHGEADKLQKEQGVVFACTECAIKAGLLAPFNPAKESKEGGNREQRRRAEREKKN